MRQRIVGLTTVLWRCPLVLQVGLQQVTLTEQYWDRVVAHCIAEIQQGRTPNPDVLCNSRCAQHPQTLLLHCICMVCEECRHARLGVAVTIANLTAC